MNHPHPDLGLPSALVKGGLRIVALGGLGEIGRNMTVFETKGKLLIVDCGVLFPEDTQPGIDLILPDFSYIRDRLDDVVGVFLTHGHEDHIGAVPYLLRERGDIAIYGSALTLALVTAKLKEHRITPLTREVREGGHEDVGPFELEFVAVNHSIPDALAVVINTDAGRVLATGDFKMDQLPLDGRITDLRTFARLGEEGVDAEERINKVSAFTATKDILTWIVCIELPLEQSDVQTRNIRSRLDVVHIRCWQVRINREGDQVVVIINSSCRLKEALEARVIVKDNRRLGAVDATF